MRRRFLAVGALLLVGIVIAIVRHTDTSGTRNVTTASSSLQPTNSAPSSAAPGRLRVSNADNGRTIVMAIGASLQVSLESTSWVLGSDTSILAQAGETTLDAGSDCVPGVACGTTTATFVAKRQGIAHVRATRSYCGEDVKCSPDNDTWTVNVVIH